MSPDDRDRVRPARRPRRARPRGPLDAVRGPGAAARRDPRARRPTRATARMQEIYSEPIKAELVTARLARDPRGRGDRRRRAHARSAPRSSAKTVVDAGRRPLRHPRHDGVSAEHVSSTPSRSTSRSSSTSSTCRSSSAARDLHGGAAPDAHRRGRRARRLRRRRGHTPPASTLGIHAPMATAVADVAGARRDYMDESGGRYVHVIADGGARHAAATSSRRSPAAPTPSCWAARSPAPPMRRAADGTGAPRRTTPSCRAARGSRSAPGRSGDPLRARGRRGHYESHGSFAPGMATTGYSDVTQAGA